MISLIDVKFPSSIDLIHDTRHLCTRLRCRPFDVSKGVWVNSEKIYPGDWFEGKKSDKLDWYFNNFSALNLLEMFSDNKCQFTWYTMALCVILGFLYTLFLHSSFCHLCPQKAKARRGGRSGKDTAVTNIKLKEVMKIKVN